MDAGLIGMMVAMGMDGIMDVTMVVVTMVVKSIAATNAVPAPAVTLLLVTLALGLSRG